MAQAPSCFLAVEAAGLRVCSHPGLLNRMLGPLKETWVWFPPPTSGSLKLPLTPAPGDLTPFVMMVQGINAPARPDDL